MPDALKRKLCEPTEKGVATIAASMNPLLGIPDLWERTRQIQRTRGKLVRLRAYADSAFYHTPHIFQPRNQCC